MPSDKAERDSVESLALERSSVEGSIVASLCKTLVVEKTRGKKRATDEGWEGDVEARDRGSGISRARLVNRFLWKNVILFYDF